MKKKAPQARITKTSRAAKELTPRESRLRAQNVRLRARLSDAEETVRALRAGEVDALIVEGPLGEQIFTLQGAERSYRILVENLREGAMTCQEDGTILYCNNYFAEMVGVPLHDIISSSLQRFVTSNDEERFWALIRQSERGEIILQAPGGSAVYTQVSVRAFLGESGEKLLSIVITDLSSQKRDEAILASGRLATSVLEQAAEGMMVCDSHGRIVRANHTVTRFCQQAPLLRLFDEVFTCPVLRQSVAQALQGDGTRAEVNALEGAGGQHFDILVSASPLRSDAHPVMGAVITFIDVTELKETQARLEAAIKSRDEFLSIASHELRTPLTSLQMQVQTLQRQLDKEFTAEIRERWVKKINVAYYQTTRLEKLINALLDVSRLKSGTFGLELEEFDLTDATRDVVERLAEEAQRSGSKLVFWGMAKSVGYWDRVRSEQVVVNLVSNALKYGGGKPVDVSVDVQDNTVSIDVLDRGIGISTADTERIFQQFERAVSAKNYGGLGLGLFITRQIVHAVGGSIEVDSRLGEGSRFRVRLPIRKRGKAMPSFVNAAPQA